MVLFGNDMVSRSVWCCADVFPKSEQSIWKALLILGNHRQKGILRILWVLRRRPSDLHPR